MLCFNYVVHKKSTDRKNVALLFDEFINASLFLFHRVFTVTSDSELQVVACAPLPAVYMRMWPKNIFSLRESDVVEPLQHRIRSEMVQ